MQTAKKCSLRYGCGLQCKNDKNEPTERQNAQRSPGSAFDRHRAEIQQSKEEIKVNYRVDWNYRDVRLHNNYSFLFCLLDVCGQAIIRGNEKKNSFLNCFLTEEAVKTTPGKLLNILMTPNRLIHHATLSISPRVSSCLNFHHADSKRSSHDEKTRQTHWSCCFCILRGPSCFSTQSANSQPNFHKFFFSFWARHYTKNNIQTKSQLIIRKYSKKTANALEEKL